MTLSKLKRALAILLRKPAQKTPMKQPTKTDLEKSFKIVMFGQTRPH